MLDAKWQRLYDRIKAGWCQGQSFWRDLEGNVTHCCLVGALSFEDDSDVRVHMIEGLSQQLPVKYNNNLVTFNDDFNTTKQDVLNLIEKAKDHDRRKDPNSSAD